MNLKMATADAYVRDKSPIHSRDRALHGLVMLLLGVGLWNATLAMSEKGFYGMAFCLALFSAIAVQKNIRDLAPYKKAQALSKLDDAGADA